MRAALPLRLQAWWEWFEKSGGRHGLHPLLLAAICDRESGGGVYLWPKGPAGTGDWVLRLNTATGRMERVGDMGHGLGLMQIDRRWHPEFAAHRLQDGRFAWQVPEHNIEYATAKVLRPALDALGDLHLAVSAYNCGVGGVRKALKKLRAGADIHAQRLKADSATTHRNYSADVMMRFACFEATARNLARREGGP